MEKRKGGNKMKIKVAVIGAGGFANMVHFPSLKEIEDVEICAVCDLFYERAKSTGEKFQIEGVYTDYKKMIEQTAPNAVYIIVAPHHLFDIAQFCLSQRLNVFLEKPPGITIHQAKRLSLLAENTGAITMVGFQRRFAPVMVEAKRRVEERGGIVHCQANFFKHHIGLPPYYEGAVDLLTCDVIHSVDILRWMGGEVKKVKSIIKNNFADYPNLFLALVEFESGATGILSTNWTSGKRIYSVEMHGKGIVAFADPEKEAVFYKDNSEIPEVLRTQEAAGSEEFFKYAGFYFENKHFIDCLKEEKQPMTNLSDAYKTMELVELLYRSTI